MFFVDLLSELLVLLLVFQELRLVISKHELCFNKGRRDSTNAFLSQLSLLAVLRMVGQLRFGIHFVPIDHLRYECSPEQIALADLVSPRDLSLAINWLRQLNRVLLSLSLYLILTYEKPLEPFVLLSPGVKPPPLALSVEFAVPLVKSELLRLELVSVLDGSGQLDALDRGRLLDHGVKHLVVLFEQPIVQLYPLARNEIVLADVWVMQPIISLVQG